MVTHIDLSFRFIDFIAVADSYQSISMQLFRHRKRGDHNLIVSGSGQLVFVRSIVAVPVHNVRKACLQAFFCMLFSFCNLMTVQTSIGISVIPRWCALSQDGYKGTYSRHNRDESYSGPRPGVLSAGTLQPLLETSYQTCGFLPSKVRCFL